MIGITHLYLIGVEFLQRLCLSGGAHPIKPLQPRPHGRFHVSNQRFDLGFGFGGEIAASIELADAESHIPKTIHAITGAIAAANGADRALPSHLLFRLSRKNLVAELEACL